MCFVLFRVSLAGVLGRVGIVLILCLRYMEGIGESVGVFQWSLLWWDVYHFRFPKYIFRYTIMTISFRNYLF